MDGKDLGFRNVTGDFCYGNLVIKTPQIVTQVAWLGFGLEVEYAILYA